MLIDAAYLPLYLLYDFLLSLKSCFLVFKFDHLRLFGEQLTLKPFESDLSSLERKLTMVMFANFKSLSSPGLNVDFDKMWAILASALREIHTKNSSELSYEELYRNAYKLVLKKKGDALYNKVKQFEEAWLSGEVRAKVRGATSSAFFSGPSGALVATSNERRVAGEKFLRAIREAWEDHRVCTAMIADVLMYMVSGLDAHEST